MNTATVVIAKKIEPDKPNISQANGTSNYFFKKLAQRIGLDLA